MFHLSNFTSWEGFCWQAMIAPNVYTETMGSALIFKFYCFVIPAVTLQSETIDLVDNGDNQCTSRTHQLYRANSRHQHMPTRSETTVSQNTWQNRDNFVAVIGGIICLEYHTQLMLELPLLLLVRGFVSCTICTIQWSIYFQGWIYTWVHNEWMQNSGRNNVEKPARRKIILKWVSEKYSMLWLYGLEWSGLRYGSGAGYSKGSILKFWVPRKEIWRKVEGASW